MKTTQDNRVKPSCKKCKNIKKKREKIMNEILLYLSMRHYGHWMGIYDSLQKREQFSVKEVEKAIDEVDCSFVTLIDNKYPENFKNIYKPPFGVYCYGNYNLTTNNTLTIFADINENEKEIQMLKDNGYNLVWYNPTTKQMLETLKKYKTNNIFVLPEVKKAKDKTYQNMLVNQDIIFDNAFISEVWERKANIDYSNQAQERIYLGLSKQVLVLKPLKEKQILEIAYYARNEDINIVFIESAINEKQKKLFVNARFQTIPNSENILKSLIKK